MFKLRIIAMIFILFASTTSVQAQTQNPEVEISCSTLNIAFDVYPGAGASEDVNLYYVQIQDVILLKKK